MTRAQLAGYIYLRVRFDLVEPDERFDYFDVLQGIDNDVAVWGESLGRKFIPLANIRSVHVGPRNVMPHLFQEARATLIAAGYAVGPEMQGDLIAVRRSPKDNARVWIDTVNTVRIISDHVTDPGEDLFWAVAAILK